MSYGSVTHASLNWDIGQNNDGGIASKVYWAFLNDVETFPKATDPPTTDGEIVTITDAFTMKTGKQFFELYCTLEDGMLQSSLVGERDGKSSENTLTIFFPGNKKEVLGFLEKIKNSQLVMIVPELEEPGNQKRVMGSELLPCYLESCELTTGQSVSDRKGATITFRTVGRIAPVYEGDIPLTAAT